MTLPGSTLDKLLQCLAGSVANDEERRDLVHDHLTNPLSSDLITGSDANGDFVQFTSDVRIGTDAARRMLMFPTGNFFYTAEGSTNGTDHLWFLGYNVNGQANPLNSAEPSFHLGWESKFGDIMEWYLQYRSGNGVETRRPIGAQANRLTHSCAVSVTTPFTVLNDNRSIQRLSVAEAATGPSSLYFGQNGFTPAAYMTMAFDVNDAPMISCRNFASNAYLECMRLNTDDTLVLGAGGSSVKGVQLPNLTTTDRNNIVTPAEGTLIYNTTTNKLNFYNGTAWEAVTSA